MKDMCRSIIQPFLINVEMEMEIVNEHYHKLVGVAKRVTYAVRTFGSSKVHKAEICK